MRKISRFVLPVAVGALAVTGVCADPAIDTNLSLQVENWKLGFAAVQTPVLGAVAFGLVLGLLKWLRRK